jgi:hypothetical protein
MDSKAKYNHQPIQLGPLKIYNLGQDPSVPGVNEYVLRLGGSSASSWNGIKYLRLAFGYNSKGEVIQSVTEIDQDQAAAHADMIVDEQIKN